MTSATFCAIGNSIRPRRRSERWRSFSKAAISASRILFELLTVPLLGHRSRLNLDHYARFEETRDTHERAYRLASRLRKDWHHLAGFRHETLNIRGVEI